MIIDRRDLRPPLTTSSAKTYPAGKRIAEMLLGRLAPVERAQTIARLRRQATM